jgi:hypothetical protein
VAGLDDRPEDLLPMRVPATIDSFIALPRAEVMNRIAEELSR